MTTSYDAVVLAGGAARRLGGADKPALSVGGQMLLDRVLGACAGAGSTVVVGPRRPTARPVRWAREDPPGGGPLPALAAGLAALGLPVPPPTPTAAAAPAPGTADSASSSDAPGSSGSPAASGSPDAAVTSAAGAASGSPVTPVVPGFPGSPVTPVVPGSTGSPVTPVVPGSPGSPATPGASGPRAASGSAAVSGSAGPRSPAGSLSPSPGVVLVLAADLPFLTGETVRALVGGLGEGMDGVVLVDRGGRDQMLAGAYRAEALRRELALIGAEHGGLGGLPLRLLTGELVLGRIADPTGEASFDCDTWEDVAVARARLDGTAGG